MEKKVTAGSPIAQKEENVKTFFENIYLDNEITVNVIDDGVLLR